MTSLGLGHDRCGQYTANCPFDLCNHFLSSEAASAFVTQVMFKFRVCGPSEFFLVGILEGKRGNDLLNTCPCLIAAELVLSAFGSQARVSLSHGVWAMSRLIFCASYSLRGWESCLLFAISIHSLFQQTSLQGGLFLSTLQMSLCAGLGVQFMCPSCLSSHWDSSGLGIWSLLFLEKKKKKKGLCNR